METLADLSPIFTAGIFFVATLSFLLVGINSLLNAKIKPLEKQLENHVTETKADIKEIKADIKNLKADIKKILENQK